MIALASVMVGMLGAGSAHASDTADAYNFFAGERARAAAVKASPEAASVKPATVKPVREKRVAAGAPKAQRKRTARKKPVNSFPDNIAPAHLAQGQTQPQAQPDTAKRRRTVAAGKPLGYHDGSRERYRTLIAQHAAANGIPFALGDAVVRVESRYQPHVSNRGALGLMQIKHTTARGLGYGGSARGLMEPETNIKYGMKYLAQAYRLAGGDTCGTVMRYQSGHYAKRINRANLAYCAKVRTIVASLGTEVAAIEAPAGAARTRVE